METKTYNIWYHHHQRIHKILLTRKISAFKWKRYPQPVILARVIIKLNRYNKQNRHSTKINYNTFSDKTCTKAPKLKNNEIKLQIMVPKKVWHLKNSFRMNGEFIMVIKKYQPNSLDMTRLILPSTVKIIWIMKIH